MKFLIKNIFVLLVSSAAVLPASAQTKKQLKEAAKLAEVKERVESKNFIFQARYVYPLGGGQIFLNTDYDVRVTKDSVITFLPYFGVAYSAAGYNSGEDNGIKLTSTKFDYYSELKKNGTWYITIKPRDSRTINQMIFNIRPNGNADLAINSNYRQQIRFDGYLKDKPKTKK